MTTKNNLYKIKQKNINAIIFNADTDYFIKTITAQEPTTTHSHSFVKLIYSMVKTVVIDDIFLLIDEVYETKPIFVNIRTQEKVILINEVGLKVNNIFDDLEIIL